MEKNVGHSQFSEIFFMKIKVFIIQDICLEFNSNMYHIHVINNDASKCLEN